MLLELRKFRQLQCPLFVESWYEIWQPAFCISEGFSNRDSAWFTCNGNDVILRYDQIKELRPL